MKAVILAEGRGTEFLPLSQVVPKHYLPLADKPAFRYLVEEIKASETEEIVFVNPAGYGKMQDYFFVSEQKKKMIEDEELLKEIEELEQIKEDLKISSVTQEKPSGNGDALLETKDLIGEEPFAVLFISDILDSKTPALQQLQQAFKTSEKPVLGLKEVEEEQVSNYDIASPEKIARGLYKVKDIAENPTSAEAPSRLAVLGRSILTPEIFDYLESLKEEKERTIAAALEEMRNDGKVVYGKQLNGEWLNCGTKLGYLKSNLYQIINNEKYGEEINQYLNEIS